MFRLYKLYSNRLHRPERRARSAGELRAKRDERGERKQSAEKGEKLKKKSCRKSALTSLRGASTAVSAFTLVCLVAAKSKETQDTIFIYRRAASSERGSKRERKNVCDVKWRKASFPSLFLRHGVLALSALPMRFRLNHFIFRSYSHIFPVAETLDHQVNWMLSKQEGETPVSPFL